jgi:hypothetical protein
MGKAKKPAKQPELTGLAPLLEPLSALQRLLNHFDNKGVIIGGIAASLLGQPRLTADLDAVILLSIKDLPELIEVAAQDGIVGRIADAEAFAAKNRVLLLQHQSSGIKIDISLGILPFEAEMIDRGQEILVSNILLRLPTPEDLIIMKAVAHRPKDMADIQAIAASHPDLDKERIRLWVEQFGEALDLPELWKMISQLL